jgi:xylulokinase
MNRWVKNMSGDGQTYDELNASAAKIEAGSEGLSILPFGNGAERMLNNKTIGAQLYGIDLNHHSMAHMYRATQEGIAFAFRYGLDIMRQNGMNPSVIRAGRSNMFRSEVFTDAFVNTLNVPVELYEGDGSRGAALGAGMGAGIYKCAQEMFREFKPVKRIAPDGKKVYDKYYELWMEQLQKQLN